jgi:hypothetical protein
MTEPTPLGMGVFPAGTKSGFRTQNRTPATPGDLAPVAILAILCRHAVVPLAWAGSEAPAGFWTSLAGHYKR